MQGFVVIDEAAFHEELKELMKAAIALLIWGGRVLVISTHNGEDNYFNQLVKAARAGKGYGLVRFDFDEALKDGLYKRVCIRTRQEWSRRGRSRVARRHHQAITATPPTRSCSASPAKARASSCRSADRGALAGRHPRAAADSGRQRLHALASAFARGRHKRVV